MDVAMIGLRVGYALGLLVFIAYPLVLPFYETLDAAAWTWSASDRERLAHLGRNTVTLCAGTVGLAVPLGTALAVLLFRTSFPGRRLIVTLIVIMLFVPLPILVSAWQALLGANGWLPLELMRGEEARPWASGMAPAIWIHAVWALPWVTLIVGVGLTWVEPEREDEAAQQLGPWWVLALITLPRVRASILAAALFAALQTAGEISVTDMMLVRTLAEETHTQFTQGQQEAMARTLVVFLPLLVLTWASVLFVLWRLERTLPPLVASAQLPRPIALGPAWLRFLMAVAFALLVGVPLVSLVRKLGLHGHPPEWDAGTAWHFLRAEARLFGWHLPWTIGTGLATGLLVAALGLVGCWLARDSVWFRGLFFSVLMWAWVLPGPIVGIDVHDVIARMNYAWPSNPLVAACYHGPSPLPLMWVQTMRVLPIAAVFLWPIVRMIPRELFEEARLAGAGAASEFMHVVWPMTRRAALATAFITSALCLAEVGASVRVETPGWPSFTKMLFDRMHYGVEHSVSALSLLMLGSVALFVLGALRAPK